MNWKSKSSFHSGSWNSNKKTNLILGQTSGKRKLNFFFFMLKVKILAVKWKRLDIKVNDIQRSDWKSRGRGRKGSAQRFFFHLLFPILKKEILANSKYKTANVLPLFSLLQAQLSGGKDSFKRVAFKSECFYKLRLKSLSMQHSTMSCSRLKRKLLNLTLKKKKKTSGCLVFVLLFAVWLHFYDVFPAGRTAGF